MKKQRLNRVIENMKNHNLQEMIISSPASIFYLTDKWIEPGERMFVLYVSVDGRCKLFINELFPTKADEDLDMVIYNDRDDCIKILSEHIHSKEIGIDKNWPSHFLIRLMERKRDISFRNGSSVIDEVRMIKDSEEIDLMRQASRVNDKVMADLISIINKGYEEKKIGKLLADIYEKYNTYSFSFTPLIAYGANAAEPHHDSDNTLPKDGDSIILDIGGITNRYCSDMTRTVFLKNASDEAKKVYNLVLEANMKGIEAVKPGTRFSDIDKAARNVIENAGYGKYFTHRTGHNIGIEVHEFPDVSGINNMEVKPGMIFSIEPGIYLPGNLGVRIEDLVVVTDNGCEVLNAYSKSLQTV